MYIKTGYAPRPLQAEIHQSLKRFNVLVCHRRFGKTVLCINELIDSALRCDRPMPRYAYIAPLYRQAKQAAWDYLKGYTQELPDRVPYDSELKIEMPNKGRIQLFGADNPDAIRGVYLDGVILDEYAQMPPKLWTEVIRPALSDRKGWAIFIGTPKGRNEFCRLYEYAQEDTDDEWFGALYRASETNVIDATELESARRVMSEEEYAQEYECSFEAAIMGAYYGKLMAQAERDGRITSVPHDAAEVETWWDLGIGDATSIWFIQRVGKELRAIDFYESSGEGLAHYAKVLKDKSNDLGYNYSVHLLPHDAEVRELGTGKSRREILVGLGIKPEIQRRESVQEGIEAVRTIIPMTWFDAEKCARGIEALRQYRKHFDEKRQAFSNHPLHDWTSHPADAFRTGARYRRAEFAPLVLPDNHISNHVI